MESLRAAGPVSLIVTVRNDREGLKELLDALTEQTEMPDEIVIVDGGSEDGTLQELERWKPGDTPVNVVVAPDVNIAAGRNIAVRIARNDWLACTDAGCRPAPSWLAALRRARDFADIATGTFVVDKGSPFELAVACTYYPWPEEEREHSPFVRLAHRLFGRTLRAGHASGRSLGFSRAAWEAVGGFPENVYATEDIAFSAAAVESGYRAVLVQDAVVFWRPRGTWRENARLFFTYSRGDVRTPGRGRHVIRLTAWAGAPALALKGSSVARVLLAMGTLYYLWLPLRRAYRHGLPVGDWWRIPLLVTLKDLSQIAGAARGLIDALQGLPQPTPRPRSS